MAGISKNVRIQRRIAHMRRRALRLELENQLYHETVVELERECRALRQEIMKDPLTGTLNRVGLRGAWNELAAEATAVASVDIDHFKKINDTYGHASGDRALQHVAEAMRVPGAIPVRISGDEFIIILTKDPRETMEEIMERVRVPVLVKGNKILVTISVGIQENNPNMTLSQLLDLSDNAMYVSKRNGRDTITRGAHQ